MQSKLIKYTLTIILTLIIILITTILISLLITPAKIDHFVDFTNNILEYQNKFVEADIPSYSSLNTRDNSSIYYRKYPAITNNSQNIVILYHGSSAHSLSMHLLALQLSKQNIEVYALDTRGHGKDQNKGKIKYIGKLEDDLEDLIISINPQNKKIHLMGLSSGGGFVLRVAGDTKMSKYFASIIAISPMISPNSPTYTKTTDLWASPSIPRIITLTILNQFNIKYFNDLNVINFAVDKNALKTTNLTPNYSFNLQQNYGLPARGYDKIIKNINTPTTVIIGQNDELFDANQFEPELKKLNSKINIILIKDQKHLDMIMSEEAIKKISSLVK